MFLEENMLLIENMLRLENILLTLCNKSVKLIASVRIFLLVAIEMACTTAVLGQDKLEMGLYLGASYYMGDVNPSQHFKDTRPAIGFIGRYAFSDRLAAKLNVIGARLEGEYPSGGDIYLNYGGKEYEFERTIVDVGVTGEFNFMSYDHMFFKDKSRFTPYLTAGLAATCYKSYEEESDGKQRIVLSLPFGIGAKYKINEWLRVGFEWTMRKTFCDDLDLVGDTRGTINPADPYGMGKRVLTHNNDWYSLAGITVTMSMWPRKLECNDGTRSFNK